ncbi:MAG TPA: hypothetical protein VD788_14680 [Candidatus Polarisedimenticolaceae bacterium]|nr:hypothetical protein [Candidatus Polarisedimenticolaceae bacterium]
MTPLPPDPAALLPHDGVARFVDRVLELDADRIVCAGRIPEGSPFAVAGRAPSFLAIELAAQAAALLECARREGPSRRARLGYLVRVRRAEFGGPFLAVEQTLRVHVRRSAAAPPLYRYDAEVESAGERCFAGSISTFVETERAAR